MSKSFETLDDKIKNNPFGFNIDYSIDGDILKIQLNSSFSTCAKFMAYILNYIGQFSMVIIKLECDGHTSFCLKNNILYFNKPKYSYMSIFLDEFSVFEFDIFIGPSNMYSIKLHDNGISFESDKIYKNTKIYLTQCSNDINKTLELMHSPYVYFKLSKNSPFYDLCNTLTYEEEEIFSLLVRK